MSNPAPIIAKNPIKRDFSSVATIKWPSIAASYGWLFDKDAPYSALDLVSKINYNQMLSVVLTHDEHVKFTNAWLHEIGRLGDYSDVSVNEIWASAQRIYADCPELLSAARITLFGG